MQQCSNQVSRLCTEAETMLTNQLSLKSRLTTPYSAT